MVWDVDRLSNGVLLELFQTVPVTKMFHMVEFEIEGMEMTYFFLRKYLF